MRKSLSYNTTSEGVDLVQTSKYLDKVPPLKKKRFLFVHTKLCLKRKKNLNVMHRTNQKKLRFDKLSTN